MKAKLGRMPAADEVCQGRLGRRDALISADKVSARPVPVRPALAAVGMRIRRCAGHVVVWSEGRPLEPAGRILTLTSTGIMAALRVQSGRGPRAGHANFPLLSGSQICFRPAEAAPWQRREISRQLRILPLSSRPVSATATACGPYSCVRC